MKREIAIGLAAVVGVAVFEAALIPGVLLGGAALLAPKYLAGRRRHSNRRSAKAPQNETTPAPAHRAPEGELSLQLPKSAIGRSIAKTITFRIIVKTLDFTTNYVVIGEIATAAGLSTFNLIAGPVFYFVHETAWSYLGSPEAGVRVPLLSMPQSKSNESAGALTISPALAKTITYRAIATVTDFTANYVVVGNVAEAVILSATGFLLGPFVYFGHEKAWEYLADRPPTRLGPPYQVEPVPASG